MLIANVIDDFSKGLFMPSYVRTLGEVFGKGKIALVADSSFDDMGISTMIVAASPADHPWKEVEKTSGGTCFVIPPQEVDRKLQNRFALVLTDDKAPVDNLTAPIFEERFGKKRVEGLKRKLEHISQSSFDALAKNRKSRHSCESRSPEF